jgi:hypothetical protein
MLPMALAIVAEGAESDVLTGQALCPVLQDFGGGMGRCTRYAHGTKLLPIGEALRIAVENI